MASPPPLTHTLTGLTSDLAHVVFHAHTDVSVVDHQHLHVATKRVRDQVFVDGNEHIILHDVSVVEHQVQHDVDDGAEDGSSDMKKVKLDDMSTLEDDPMLDDIKSPQLVMGGVGDMLNSQGLGIGVSYFASTGNIKSPIFEGIPSLTPEWLLKKVWLKVNGDLEQNVLASLISKDMGPKLRQEIRSFLEKRGEIQTGNRINLKNTIMQAVEITITCQKEKPTLTIIRDSKQRSPKKEGKSEKNFTIALTPYGQSVCSGELQLKKRDSFTQRSPSKINLNGIHMGMGLGIALDQQCMSPLNVLPPSPTSLPASPMGSSSSFSGVTLNMWKPTMKELSDELYKRNLQVGDLSGQLISMKDELVLLKDEYQKKDMIIAELKNIIMELKPNFTFPPHLLNISDITPLLDAQTLQIHQQSDQTHMLHIVDNSNLMSEPYSQGQGQSISDAQSFLPQ